MNSLLTKTKPQPPSLSDGDHLRFGVKSDFLQCLESVAPSVYYKPPCSAVIIDASALVQMLKPIGANTSQQYTDLVFITKLVQQLQAVDRLDLVWDSYLECSLKDRARKKRGHGLRIRISSQSHIPKNWQQFLLYASNKTEFFNFYLEKFLVCV